MRSLIEKLLEKALTIGRTASFDATHFGAEANWVCQGENC